MTGLDVRRMRPNEKDRFDRLYRQAFFLDGDIRPWTTDAPLEWHRVVVRDGRVAGGLKVEPLGQFYGGRSVPAAGICAVAVAPEERGMGAGSHLINAVIDELRSDGILLATLHPSDSTFYRRLGFEFSGNRLTYETDVRELPTSAPESVVEWDDDLMPAVAECYHRFASAHSGMLDRRKLWWSMRLTFDPASSERYRYAVVRDGSVVGYAIYTHLSAGALKYSMPIQDLVWLDASALSSLLALLASSRATATTVSWYGPADDAVSLSLRQERVAIVGKNRSMSRVTDVRGALEARGYPEGVTATVALTVHGPRPADPVDVVRLHVEDGRGTVERASDAWTALDIGTFTAIFTGFARASSLARMGRIGGVRPTDLAALDAIFAGPPPWMMDQF